jgi:hypothetical protein
MRALALLLQAVAVLLMAAGVWLVWLLAAGIFIGDPPMKGWVIVDHVGAFLNFVGAVALIVAIMPGWFLFFLFFFARSLDRQRDLG